MMKKQGGRILGNLCHWTDATLNLIELKRLFPGVITPTFMEIRAQISLLQSFLILAQLLLCHFQQRLDFKRSN